MSNATVGQNLITIEYSRLGFHVLLTQQILLDIQILATGAARTTGCSSCIEDIGDELSRVGVAIMLPVRREPCILYPPFLSH